MFRSLRLRMAVSHASVLAVILLLLGGVGQALLAASLDRGATAAVIDAARDEVDRMVEEGAPEVPPDSDVPSDSAVRLAVFLPGGRPLVGDVVPPVWLRPHGSQVVDTRAQGEPVRVVTLPARSGGRLIATVVAGRSLAPERSLLHRVRLLLLLGGFAAVGAAVPAGWWLAGRASRPIRRAYEAQSSFAADASHELRTPLAFVRSGVETMAERDPGLGGQVLSEIDYLTGLTQRLLVLARADRGGLRLEERPFDVAEVCRSAARRASEVHGLRLELSEGNGALVVLGDSTAAEAALDAVLENVAAHGGGRAALRWVAEHGRAVVSLEDRGPGLSPEAAGAAFDRFFRADPSRARETGGGGLGLPLAKALIEAQGGSMWLEPTPGGGLTAKIALRA